MFDFGEGDQLTRCALFACTVPSGDLCWDTQSDRVNGPARTRIFSLCDTSQEDVSELAGVIVVQTQVRALFHHIKCIAEFGR